MSDPLLSLIVLNLNGRPYLSDCLPSIYGQDYPNIEVILVDNGSTDSSLEFVAENYPDVRLIANGRNLGFAGGMNVGLTEARGDILALLNNDIILKSTWARALVEVLEKESTIGVAGCKVYFEDGKTLQHAGGIIHRPRAVSDHFGFRQHDEGQFDEMRDVDYVTGAGLAFKKDVLERIGPLDERFNPIYYEEVDFCFRAREAGYRIVYVPQARMIHFESAMMVRDSHNYYTNFHRNRLQFVLKHWGASYFLEEFAPAEAEWLATVVNLTQQRGLMWAYKSLMVDIGRLVPDDSDRIDPVVDALAELRQTILNNRPEGSDIPAPVTRTTLTEYDADLMLKLSERWHIEEQSFVSRMPLIGPLIAKGRYWWNNIAARWYVLAIVAQINLFNSTVMEWARHLTGQFVGISYRLIDVEREATELVRRQAHSQANAARTEAMLREEIELLRVRIEELEQQVRGQQ